MADQTQNFSCHHTVGEIITRTGVVSDVALYNTVGNTSFSEQGIGHEGDTTSEE